MEQKEREIFLKTICNISDCGKPVVLDCPDCDLNVCEDHSKEDKRCVYCSKIKSEIWEINWHAFDIILDFTMFHNDITEEEYKKQKEDNEKNKQLAIKGYKEHCIKEKIEIDQDRLDEMLKPRHDYLKDFNKIKEQK